jgi:DNA ligase (NAD+)
MPSPAKRIAELREEIRVHDRKYYEESRPAISDREYDRLMQELIDLERQHPELVTPDSPTQRVGGDVQTELKPVRHAVPMMSIDNTYSEEEVRAFDERVRKLLGGEQPAYVLEPKIDGTSISLRYEEGRLVLAATRGRGNVGDDVTVNARTIKSIPLTLAKDAASVPLPAILEVRGEVYMDNEDFQRVNKEIEAEGEEPYANPRNLTSGTLRRLDPKIVAKRRLRFLAHGAGQVEPLPAASYWDFTRLLREWGLPLPKEVARTPDIDEALARIHEFEKVRPKLPYMTDGMVVKVDAFAHRLRLGTTSKAPRWVVAYKYETEQQPTVLHGVRWQVGKGGSLTPVADVEPVFIGGVTVTHITLHNLDQIRKLDIRLGDTVAIERAGEVIPQVVAVVKDKRPKGARQVPVPDRCPECDEKTEWEEYPEDVVAFRCLNAECEDYFVRNRVKKSKMPEGCPVCQGKVERLEKGIDLYCVNPACPAQLKERLRWFCHRGQMDIEGLGDVLVDQLVEGGHVREFADLYKLQPETIATLTSEVEQGGKSVKRTVGEKVAAKVVANVERSREQPLERLLAGLGIRHVGARVSLVLASHFGSLAAIAAATPEQLSDVHEIGPAIAQSVHDFFASASGKKTVADLQAVGIDPRTKVVKPEQAGNLPLAGKTIVVTGTLKNYSREAIEAKITQLGGRAASSVSKKTDFVLAGEEAGSKLDKAAKLGVKVVSEEEFEAMFQ